MKVWNIKKKVCYYIVNYDLIMRFKNVNVSFFNMIYSIFDSLGVCIYILYGFIVYIGEFKFD